MILLLSAAGWQGIRQAVRIQKNTVLDELPAGQWFDNLQPGQFSVVSEATCVFGERMRAAERPHRRCSGQEVVATRPPNGDLVIIATNFGVWETWNLYRLRWSVECTFGSYKSRGFDLERAGITDPKRLERLSGLVTLAWLNCLQIGVWRHAVKPIRELAHGRKAMRLVRYGVAQTEA